MPYEEGIDYPFREGNVRMDKTGLREVTVSRGPNSVEAHHNDCIDNALRFNEMYDFEVVRGYIGDRGRILIEHYWNFDGENYYDVTPFTENFDSDGAPCTFKYFIDD